MNPTMSAQAHIKQLCCLGLGGEAIMPAVLEALHKLIPSYSNCFTWSGPRGEMGKSFVENIDELLPLLPMYFANFCSQREEEVTMSFREAMAGRETVLLPEQMFKVDKRAYYQHDYYNLFCRLVHFHTSIHMVVREGGVTYGGLSMHRTSGEREFQAADKRALASLMPFIAHGLSAAPRGDLPLADSDREAFAIASNRGELKYVCPEARRLLIFAAQPMVSAGVRTTQVQLPAAVARLCQRFAAVFSNREPARLPPCHHHINCLGGFTFRAYGLNREGLADAAPEPAPLIGIHIQHQEPVPVRVIRRLGTLPSLSQRQMQICVLLATNKPQAKIAAQMNMSPHTVVTHTRRLYEKLDVHNRAELVSKLTAR